MAKKRRKKSKSKSRRKTSKKRATRKTSKKRTSKKRSKKTRRSGQMPSAVIIKHARTLKKNKRAAAIYRDVLGC